MAPGPGLAGFTILAGSAEAEGVPASWFRLVASGRVENSGKHDHAYEFKVVAHDGEHWVGETGRVEVHTLRSGESYDWTGIGQVDWTHELPAEPACRLRSLFVD